jgi:Rod binding domain-containing protein
MGFDVPAFDPVQIGGSSRGAATMRAIDGLRLAPGMDPAEARRAAEDFEAVFISQMLAPMFEGISDDEYFGGGPGEDIYRSMMVEEYGKSIAKAGGFGLADAVQREILRLQEAATP